MRLKLMRLLVVSRDNNLYVVGDISRKCLDTTETNNYHLKDNRGRIRRETFNNDLTISMHKDEVGHT